MTVGDGIIPPFDPGSTTLSSLQKSVLDELAKNINASTDEHIVINVESRDNESSEMQEGLNGIRKDVIFRYLASKGVGQNRLQMISHGKEKTAFPH